MVSYSTRRKVCLAKDSGSDYYFWILLTLTLIVHRSGLLYYYYFWFLLAFLYGNQQYFVFSRSIICIRANKCVLDSNALPIKMLHRET